MNIKLSRHGQLRMEETYLSMVCKNVPHFNFVNLWSTLWRFFWMFSIFSPSCFCVSLRTASLEPRLLANLACTLSSCIRALLNSCACSCRPLNASNLKKSKIQLSVSKLKLLKKFHNVRLSQAWLFINVPIYDIWQRLSGDLQFRGQIIKLADFVVLFWKIEIKVTFPFSPKI